MYIYYCDTQHKVTLRPWGRNQWVWSRRKLLSKSVGASYL